MHGKVNESLQVDEKNVLLLFDLAWFRRSDSAIFRKFAVVEKKTHYIPMENFIVSARKYRPATFEDVVGQQSLANTLKRAIINHKLAGAYLFCGPRGVGKTTCARIFAKAINCLHPHADGEACNECESCISFNEQRSMNIQELNAAANNSVDDIRQIIEQVRIPPQIGNYKVIILDEVHMLSQSASNALLKTLEEPPSYVIFILATTEKQKILPTILSRCQIFDFNRMEINDIVGQLMKVATSEHIGFEEQALNVIAQKADGGMRDALSIFDQVTNFSGGNITYDSVLKCLNVLDYDYYFKMTDAFIGHRVSEALLLFNDIVNKGFDGGVFVGGLARHMRDLLVSRDAETTRLLDVAESVKQRYAAQAQQCSLKFLYKAIRKCDKCSNEYKLSYNKRLSVEITLIELAQSSDDDDGAGLVPERQIKPVFKETGSRSESPAKPVAPASVVVTTKAEAKNVEAKPLLKESEKEQEASHLQRRHIPTIRLAGKQEEVKPRQVLEEAPVEYVAGKPFDQTELNYYWNQFAAELPPQESAVSGRMRQMEVKLLENAQVEVHVNNAEVMSFMSRYIPRIEEYLKNKLNNHDVKIVQKVLVTKEESLRYNPQELLNKLMAENSGLAKMKDRLGLELD